MYRGKVIAVVVPAYNEEKLIGKVLKTIPDFIDHIVVVDDASTDQTGEVVKTHQQEDSRILYLRHPTMRGLEELSLLATNGREIMKSPSAWSWQVTRRWIRKTCLSCWILSSRAR